MDTKVSAFWKDRKWYLPRNSLELISLADNLENYQLHIGTDHKILWKLTKHGRFTAVSAYNCLRPVKNHVKWWRIVWTAKVPPKYSFIMWLLCFRRLKTKDYLKKVGMVIETQCLLCSICEENCNHLFFECSYARQVWNWCLNKLGFSDQAASWELELQKMLKRTKGKSLKEQLAKQY